MNRTEKQEWIDILYYLKVGAEQMEEMDKKMGNSKWEAYDEGYARAMRRVIELMENQTEKENVLRQMKKDAERGE